MYKLPYTGAEIESLLQIKSNKNLLHNWDFRNPVNQRGQSSYNGAVYAIDRWRLTSAGTGSASDYTVSTRKLRTTAGTNSWATLYQKVEFPSAYAGKTITFSAEIETKTNAVQTQVWFKKTSGDTLTGVAINIIQAQDTRQIATSTWLVPDDMTDTGEISLVIQVYMGEVTINRAKLELGSVSTLANDPPADYGEQLALCQRYCLKLEQFIRFMNVGIQAAFIDFTIPTPSSLRTTPTIIGALEVRDFNTFTPATGFTFAVAVLSNESIMIRATKASHGLTTTQLNVPAGGVILSADL